MSLIGRSRWSYADDEKEIRVTRDMLADLVWSAPMRALAAELAISDVGLAKALRQQGIPLPERGYWAKLQAGKPVKRTALSPRQPGQDRLVPVHGALAERFRSVAVVPDDPQGPFASAAVPEDLLELRAMLLRKIGKIPVRPKEERFHRALHATLRRDERYRAKIANSSWPNYERAPVYDAPDQRRRLVIASALMIALEKLGYGSELYGAPEPSFSTRVGDHHVSVRILRPGEKTDTIRYHRDPIPPVPATPLQIELTATLPPALPAVWRDGDEKLETQLAEIAASIITAGEARFRLSISERLEHIARMQAWREEERQRKAKERNAARLAALRKSGELLSAANEIRLLLSTVRAAISAGTLVVEPDALAEWTDWANAEADRHDPTINGQIAEHLKITNSRQAR
jgi:hypothetical protein